MPTAPLRELVVEHLEYQRERNRDRFSGAGMSFGLGQDIEHASYAEAYLARDMSEILGCRVGEKWIQRLVRGEVERVHFDRADALLCAMNLYWTVTDELWEIYQSVDLSEDVVLRGAA